MTGTSSELPMVPADPSLSAVMSPWHHPSFPLTMLSSFLLIVIHRAPPFVHHNHGAGT